MTFAIVGVSLFLAISWIVFLVKISQSLTKMEKYGRQLGNLAAKRLELLQKQNELRQQDHERLNELREQAAAAAAESNAPKNNVRAPRARKTPLGQAFEASRSEK